MNQYFIIALIFGIGFSILQVPFGYSLDGKNNSYTYYEKNCENDSCVITTCGTNQSCTTTGANNSTTNITKEQINERGNLDSKSFELMNFWKNFMNFD